MTALLGLALKSLIVTAISLILLRAMWRRSAAERSLIAHLGLAALIVLPLAGLALPALNLPAPVPAMAIASPVIAPITAAAAGAAAVVAAEPVRASAVMGQPLADWTRIAYGAPVAGLLLLTLLALLRLFVLSRRAEVLVEPAWLSALAHAQRRMGLKSGTALLVSDALPSPVSWGWARPVILLNRAALDATDEAEAIIAHELAHVASLDWAKLMLARVATALFWFNPLVWLLAREAHQLREEAADDVVLATAIPASDYAQLLVGVARHEVKSLLLGAHGVAPGKGSLRRRIRRVLDTTLARRPAGGAWIAGFGTGMLVMAAPLAALTVGAHETADNGSPSTRAPAALQTSHEPLAAETGLDRLPADRSDPEITTISGNGHRVTMLAADGGHRKAVVDGRRSARTPSAVDDAIAMKATGVTPDYVAEMRAAAAWQGGFGNQDAVAMQALGVTPAYVSELAAAGFAPLRSDDVAGAKAVGVTGDFARTIAAAGFRGNLDRLIEMRAIGMTPADFARSRAGLLPHEKRPPPR